MNDESSRAPQPKVDTNLAPTRLISHPKNPSATPRSVRRLFFIPKITTPMNNKAPAIISGTSRVL
jgi:hypothetical protein